MRLVVDPPVTLFMGEDKFESKDSMNLFPSLILLPVCTERN